MMNFAVWRILRRRLAWFRCDFLCKQWAKIPSFLVQQFPFFNWAKTMLKMSDSALKPIEFVWLQCFIPLLNMMELFY